MNSNKLETMGTRTAKEIDKNGEKGKRIIKLRPKGALPIIGSPKLRELFFDLLSKLTKWLRPSTIVLPRHRGMYTLWIISYFINNK